MKRALSLFVLVASLVVSSLAIADCASAAEGPVGVWATGALNYIFRVSRCGRFFCVALLYAPENVADVHNPDPAKRRRKIAGMTLVSDGAAAGVARWEGNVYNWEDGKTYYGYVEPIDSRTMKATGCMVGRVMCLSTRLFKID